MAYLGAGQHMVSHNAVYGPARGIMEGTYSRFGVEATYIDTTDLDQVVKAIRPNTKLIYLETPANPTIGISDIPAICEIAHQHNILVCVDNTFCSPYLQNPLLMGADIVLHSLTKFINGHADIVGGLIGDVVAGHAPRVDALGACLAEHLGGDHHVLARHLEVL